jgi:hypothetical protein
MQVLLFFNGQTLLIVYEVISHIWQLIDCAVIDAEYIDNFGAYYFKNALVNK